MVAEFVLDGGDNLGASGGEIGITGRRLIDENERSRTGNAYAMEEFAFETALFDKPSGIDFEAVVAMIDWVAFGFGGCGVGL